MKRMTLVAIALLSFPTVYALNDGGYGADEGTFSGDTTTPVNPPNDTTPPQNGESAPLTAAPDLTTP